MLRAGLVLLLPLLTRSVLAATLLSWGSAAGSAVQLVLWVLLLLQSCCGAMTCTQLLKLSQHQPHTNNTD
jgi:hypothetical protein